MQECCNSPYGNQYFAEYAEEIPGNSTDVFSKAAADNGVFLIAGDDLRDIPLLLIACDASCHNYICNLDLCQFLICGVNALTILVFDLPPNVSVCAFIHVNVLLYVCICAGSIPERKDGKLYNTMTVFSPDGTMIAKHQKVFNAFI